MKAHRIRMLLIALWVGVFAPTTARSHEAPVPKASVVMRDGGHCTLSLQFDLAKAWRQTLQPQMSMAEFLALASAQAPADFAREWARLTARWSQEVMLQAGPARLEAQRWRWPAADEAQTHLRQQLMQSLTGGDAPDHAPALLGAQAEFMLQSPKLAAPIDLSNLFLALPAAFRPITLTSYRPHQRWIGSGASPIPLKF